MGSIYESTTFGTQREATTCSNKQSKIDKTPSDYGANPRHHYRQPNGSPADPKGLINLEHGIE